MSCGNTNFIIRKGKTFKRIVRWEVEPYVYKAITAITQSAPVQITSPSHGLVDGWRTAVVSAKGMLEINAADFPPRDSQFNSATVVSSSVITLNKVNSSDFTAYTEGGYLVYLTPDDLADHVASFKAWPATIGVGTPLIDLTSPLEIDVDDVAKTITVQIDAADTALYDWKRAVYELTMTDLSSFVTRLLSGELIVEP